MKLQFGILGAALAAAIAVFVLYQPDSRTAHVDPAPVAVVPPAPEDPEPLTPKRAVPKPPPAPVEQAEDASVADAEEVDAAPGGPFTVSLGEHTVHLRDKPWVLHVEPALVTSSYTTRTEIIRTRKKLIRMVFFLGSHRSKLGSEGDDGEARFKGDLIERIRNVIKTGPVDRLELHRYEVAEWVPPDAAVEPAPE